MYFWMLVVVGYGGVCCFKKKGMNWIILVLMNNRLGLLRIIEVLGILVWFVFMK